MAIQTVATPKFPLILMDDELNELVEKHELTQIEEASDVVIFDGQSQPLAHYIKDRYEDAVVFKRAQTS